MTRQADRTYIHLLRFMGFFLAINILLFLPYFLFFPEKWPVFSDLSLSVSSIFTQHTSLPFRFSIEMILPYLLFALIGFRSARIKQVLLWITCCMFCLLFLYQVYYFFYWKIYAEFPYFLNDFILVREVVPIFFSTLGVSNYIIGFGLSFIIGGIFILGYFLIKRAFYELSRTSSSGWPVALFSLLLFLGLAGFWRHNTTDFKLSDNHVQAITRKVVQSAFLPGGRKYKKLNYQETYQEYFQYDLRQKPDIYMIFVESYGSVGPLMNETAGYFDSLYFDLEKGLRTAGWHYRSAFSNSPIRGGRSWLGFTTALSGLHVENHVQYNDLIKYNPDYPHLVHYLKSQEYKTIRIGTMRATEKTDSLVPYGVTDLFWRYDQRYNFRDIPYSGYEYDYFGGIPDQFSLNHVFHDAIRDTDQPVFLFFITMNSHGPWYQPPPLLKDYKELNNIISSPYKSDKSLDRGLIKRYAESMDYELRMLQQFIIDHGDDDDIFILIGDHQPPGLEYKLEGKYSLSAVPLHIISQNEGFIGKFERYGMVDRLDLKTSDPLIHHAGFYSLFMAAFLNHYSDADSLKVRPQGIQ